MAKLIKTLQVCALVVVCFGIPVALWQGLRLVPQSLGNVPSVSYVEMVTILLTAITVILAILAVMVGIAAFWGFEAIKNEAILSASKTSKTFMAAHVQSEAMRVMIREVVAEQGVEPMTELYTAAYPPESTVGPEDPNQLTEYPKNTPKSEQDADR